MGNPNAIPPPNRPRFSATYQPPAIPKRLSKVKQLVQLQDVMKEKALNPECNAKDCAALACAWERLENRLGRMKMKPEPKPVEVSLKPRRAQAGSQAGPAEGPLVLPKAG